MQFYNSYFDDYSTKAKTNSFHKKLHNSLISLMNWAYVLPSKEGFIHKIFRYKFFNLCKNRMLIQELAEVQIEEMQIMESIS